MLVYLALHPDEFDARIARGRVVDGHGDLRPEHVYLTSPPVVIDCIEFNAELRHVDVLDELSFLEAECAGLQAAETGAAIREKCMALIWRSGTDRAGRLLQVVPGLRAGKSRVAEGQTIGRHQRIGKQLALARQYLDLADQIRPAVRPAGACLLVRGLSGTGKSTVARALADRLGIELLQTDAVRQELVRKGNCPADPPAAKYSANHRQQVYDEMLSSAEQLLDQHASVILDGTFLSQDESGSWWRSWRVGSAPVG